MTKNTNFVSHKKSKQKNQDGTPQLPLASALVEGEIAINFAENVETLSIKNESGHVVTFSSDNYYTEKKLGSAFTGANSAVTVTDVIEENEEIVATALNDLNENKLDVSAYTPTDLSDYYTKEEVDVRDLWVSGTGENAVVLKGGNNIASGGYSHAEGYSTSATSFGSHAEGYSTLASGNSSHAEGSSTIASGYYSHAEGDGTKAIGDQSHAEGQSTSATSYQAHAEGYGTLASGIHSHAEGAGTTANGSYSHAEGSSTLASGYYSHAEGQQASATSQSSHAEGSGTLASGEYSHAEGYGTLASGHYSHAESDGTKAIGDQSHAEGYNTIARGVSSHAEGHGTTGSGEHSHAEGYGTLASGHYSHAEGYFTIASSNSSHAEGYSTITNNLAEHASGQYNVSNSASTTFGDSGNTLFSVGNGTGNARHNAFEIRQNGDIYIVNKDGNDVKLQDEIGNITIDQVIDSGTSASTNAVATKAVYDAITDNELVWTNAYVAMSGIVSAHTANTEIHVTAADKEKLHTHSNKSALDAITGTVGTMAYQNANSYSSATQVNTALGNKLNTSDFNTYSGAVDTAIGNKASQSDLNTLSGTVTGHTADTTIHVTSADKTAWNAKLDSSDIADFFDDAKYELSGTTHVINFYNDNAIKATIDAEPFIVDGMVESVSAGTSGTTTVLDIKWNTAAGGQETILDIGDIFEADNYYTTAQTSGATELTTAFEAKLSTSDFNTYSGAVDTTIGNKASQSDLNTLSGTVTGHTADTTIHFTTGTVQTQIDNSISGKVNTSDIVSAITPSNSGSTAPIATKVVAENELVMSNALTDLDDRKLDASAYTPTDLSNYYTKSETSGASEISTALNGKSDTSHTHASSAITSMAGYSKPNVTSAIATTDTLNQAIGKLECALGGMKLEKITQAAYDALVTKDSNTLYIITD